MVLDFCGLFLTLQYPQQITRCCSPQVWNMLRACYIRWCLQTCFKHQWRNTAWLRLWWYTVTLFWDIDHTQELRNASTAMLKLDTDDVSTGGYQQKILNVVEYKPVQLAARPVVQVEPTSSAAQVARHAVIAAVQGWHPSVPGDQLDMVCRTACRASVRPVCWLGVVLLATTACEVCHSCITCPTAEMHPTTILTSNPIQQQHAPLRVHTAMWSQQLPDQLCAASVASSSPMSKEVMVISDFIQPGGAWSTWGDS